MRLLLLHRYRDLPLGRGGHRVQPGLHPQQECVLRAVQDLAPRVLLHANRRGQGHQASPAPTTLHPRQGPGELQGVLDDLRSVPPRLEEARPLSMGRPRLVAVQRAGKPDQPQRLGRTRGCLRLGPQPRPHFDHLGPALAVFAKQRQADRR